MDAALTQEVCFNRKGLELQDDLHRCDEALRQVERAEELLIYSEDRSNRCRYRVEALTGADDTVVLVCEKGV